MKEENLRQRTFSSLIWKLFERMGAQLIQFVVSLILARILMPSDYGAIALLTVFIAVAQVFVQNGFSSALIRKLDADELDYSSVFYFGLLISVIIYVILFFTAPYIADFYEVPILDKALKVLALVVIIGSYNSIQNTILAKKLLFKKLFISTFGATILSGGLGIAMAYLGYGIWALVIQQLSAILFTTIIMQFTVKWHPRLMFSIKRIKLLLSFGWKLLFAGLLDVIYNNLYSLIIGKQYSDEELAYWNRGKQFPDLIVGNINGSIGSVMFPFFSIKQNNKTELKSAVRRSIKISAFLVFPMMVGLAVIAEPLVKLLLTDKWLFCVPFLQGWCIINAFMPVHTTNLQVYNALGRSDIFLWLEVLKKVIGIIVLFATLYFGLIWMMIGKIIVSVVCTFINAFPNIKILKYSLKEQLGDLIPIMLVSAAMGGLTFSASLIPINYVAVMVIQILIGVVSYILLSYVFKLEAFKYCLGFLNKIMSGIKAKKKCDKVNGKNKKSEKQPLQQKKILLLGGSIYLLPVIEEIHKLGHLALTCDYLPDNIAHKYGDGYYNVSITDKDAVLKLAEELKIDGIMSFATDPGVVTAAYVAEKLGLPIQVPLKSAEILQNKEKFRQFLSDNGFNTPRAYSYDNYNRLIETKDKFDYPMIVKPVDSAGSKGVSKVECDAELENAYKYATDCSISKKAIIEEFIEKEGCSSDSDCFVVDGRLKFVSFSNQYFDKNAVNPYTPSAYGWPSSMPENSRKELTEELQRLMTLLNIKSSLFNIETRLAANGKTYIMEASPRGGGNKLSEMLYMATGVNLIQNAVKAAIGEETDIPDSFAYDGYYAEVILHSDRNGIFDKLEIDDGIKQFVVKTELNVKSGDEVEAFTGANKTVGTIAFKFDNGELMDNLVKNIAERVKVIVK